MSKAKLSSVTKRELKKIAVDIVSQIVVQQKKSKYDSGTINVDDVSYALDDIFVDPLDDFVYGFLLEELRKKKISVEESAMHRKIERLINQKLKGSQKVEKMTSSGLLVIGDYERYEDPMVLIWEEFRNSDTGKVAIYTYRGPDGEVVAGTKPFSRSEAERALQEYYE